MRAIGLVFVIIIAMTLPAQAKQPHWRSVPADVRAAVDASIAAVDGASSPIQLQSDARAIAAHGIKALPWMARVAPTLDGAALRATLEAMLQVHSSAARQTIVSVIDGKNGRRANVALSVGMRAGMKFASYRLIGLLMKHRSGVLAAAVGPLCGMKKIYGLRLVRRAIDRGQAEIVKEAPKCLKHYGADGYKLAKALTQHERAEFARVGVEALVAVAATDVGRFGAETTATLTPMLRIHDRVLRQGVAMSLARMGSKPAVNALMNVAMRGQRSHSRTAILALAKVTPLPVASLKRLLLRGPTYDAAPVVKQLAKRQTVAARALILDAISAASYVTWWDDAVDAFVSQGRPAYVASVGWMRKNPEQARNVVLALKRHSRKAAPFLLELVASLPPTVRYDELRSGLVEVIGIGRPKGWSTAVAKVAADNKLSIASRTAALVALGRAKRDPIARRAAEAAVKSSSSEVRDAGRMALALLGERSAAQETIALLRKTPATLWKPVWLDTLAVFPDIDADMLLTTRFPGASNAVQARLLKLLHVGKRQRGLAHLMEVAVMRDHPLRGRALALLGHR